MTKSTVIETLDSLEDEFDIEKLIERLLFIELVEKGVRDSDGAKLINFTEVRQRFSDR